ncbi:MAG: glycosyltransferase family 2 protein [Candidatus Magasanikbacteria bacterium]
MSNQPTLSICIPTYCRANNLDQCLSTIFAQIGKNPDLLSEIEIVVSDNASTDNTRLVVEKFIKQYSNITYFINKENLGCDANYIESVVNSNGKYAWIIGDDDFILNGALDYLVKYLKNNILALYTVQTEKFVDMATVYKKRNYLENVEHFAPKAHNEFFAKNYCIGLLSSMIFNRQMWLDVDRTGYFVGWSYYEIALKMIAQSNLPFEHNGASLVSTMQSCDWIKGGTEFYYFINWNRILKKLPSFGYNINYVNQILSSFPKKLILMLLRAKANGLNCKMNDLKMMIDEFYCSPFYLLLAVIIFFVPNSFIKLIRDSRKNINASA